MPECPYCGETVGEGDAELAHLASEHDDELGRIDRRRVDQWRGVGDDDESSAAFLGIVALGVVLVLGVGAVVFAMGGNTGGEEDVHEHGTLVVEIDGERIDFDQSKYHNARGFHFHEFDGEVWHMHPSEPGRLTLAEAMARLGIELEENAIAIDGTRYDGDDSDTTVEITVNGEEVNPATYELRGTTVEGATRGEGDDVRIVVETSG